LAALASPPFEEIEQIISCEDANEYVRWAAAGTYLFLVRDGKMTRDEALSRLKHQLIKALKVKSIPLIEFLVSALCQYSPHEAEAEIRQAFEEDLVDEITIEIEEIEESLKQGEEYFQEALSRCRPTGIEDTIEELSKWYSFSTEESAPFYPNAPEMVDDWDADHWDYRGDFDTIRNLDPKIGRNDPCRCGSGKKYKKCCGKS
jgi:uncharacterized protein YecA (UPF0149 family)